MQVARPGPEFVLVRDCCRACFVAGGEPVRILPAGLDWELFLALAGRHRVEGLVSKALRHEAGVPRSIRQHLDEHGQTIALAGLRTSQESIRLRDAFAAAGVPLLFLKGLALGALAFGNPFAKRSIDIDLLVRLSDIGRAATVLLGLGYAPSPPIRAERINRWHRRSKESAWVHQKGFQVDLHSHLTDSPDALPGFDLDASIEHVSIAPGFSLATLGGTTLVAYLAVHGASSGWFRLKWLAEFAALLSRRTAKQVEAEWRACRAGGSSLATDLAFQLSHHVFGTALPPIRPTRTSNRLTRLATQLLLDPREPTRHRFGTIPIHTIQLLLEPSWPRRGREAWRQAQHALLSRGLT